MNKKRDSFDDVGARIMDFTLPPQAGIRHESDTLILCRKAKVALEGRLRVSCTFAEKLLGTKNKPILSRVMQRLSLNAIHNTTFVVALVGTAAFCPISNAATVFGSSAIASQILTVTAGDDDLSIPSFALHNGTQSVVASVAVTDPAGATAWQKI